MAEHDFYEGTTVSMASIEGLPAGSIARLEGLGLLDAQQFVDAVADPATAERLAGYLEVTQGQLREMALSAAAHLPVAFAERREALEPLSLGAFPPTAEDEERNLLPRLEAPPMAAALPASVNHAAALGQPRNQGARGTCVAFAVTAIHEFFRKTNGTPIDLSEQFLYDETKKVDGFPHTCGTWQVKAAIVLKSLGQCKESIWRYNSALPCNGNGTQPGNAKADAAARKLNLHTLPRTNVNAIKAAIAGGAVVGFSIPVFDSWYQNPTSRRAGRITLPLPDEPANGGHAMCLIGYEDQANVPGGGCFILRNSWFGHWGQQSPYGSGNGVIPYDYIRKHNWEALTF